MINMYGIVCSAEAIANKFVHQLTASETKFNKYLVRLGEQAPMIIDLNSNQILIATFGITYFVNKRKVLQGFARKEDLILDAKYKYAIRRLRCVLPATHFIVSYKNNSYCVYVKNEKPFFIAALYDEIKQERTNDVCYSMALITCPSNKVLNYHNVSEMPVILTIGQAMKWLRKDSALSSITAMLDSYPCNKIDFFSIDQDKIVNGKLNNKTVLQPLSQSFWQEDDRLRQEELARKRQHAIDIKNQKIESDDKAHKERLRKLGLIP